ncbi:hypothetical protein INR49_029091 [Caranx melampygus]|nr:hypothetical protein INR49_029091 [Caranx melampygus]
MVQAVLQKPLQPKDLGWGYFPSGAPMGLGREEGLSTGSATDDRSLSWGYESRQNPLPSSSTQAPVRLTTIGAEPPLKQLSDEPSIG